MGQNVSINRSQAEALAEGFLDDLGTDEKDELQPRETLTELFLLAGELIEDAQENLVRSNNIASGELSKSLVALEPTDSGTVVSIDVVMNFYGDFVNKGVKGTKSGQGKYQFKSEYPSKKMVTALVKYIARAGRSSTISRKKSISANEVKNASLSAINSAYALGRSIKMKGIKPTGFLDKAIATTRSKVASRLGEALRIDIINSI